MNMGKEIRGRIIKAIGGFYYVEAAGTVYECRARGVFRKKNMPPLVGDLVTAVVLEDGTGTVSEITPRKNQLVRPPIANLDQLILVVSICDPAPSTLVIDKMIAAAEDQGIEPVLVVSKTDLQDAGWLRAIYEKAGIPFCAVSSVTGEGVEAVRPLLQGKITAFTGNTGAGKSSLLNCINPAFSLATGEISQKLGRGRHTTRHVELLPVEGGYVADTPGFSFIQIERYNMVKKEDLQFCFREFSPYLQSCRFVSCFHVKEKGCAVLEAVEKGQISPSRHESYVAMYNEVKDIKEWQLK
ncbi:MAG: ribosome small subunit-dependent GTPase A [Hydrogeniiclostridium sp.]